MGFVADNKRLGFHRLLSTFGPGPYIDLCIRTFAEFNGALYLKFLKLSFVTFFVDFVLFYLFLDLLENSIFEARRRRKLYFCWVTDSIRLLREVDNDRCFRNCAGWVTFF